MDDQSVSVASSLSIQKALLGACRSEKYKTNEGRKDRERVSKKEITITTLRRTASNPWHDSETTTRRQHNDKVISLPARRPISKNMFPLKTSEEQLHRSFTSTSSHWISWKWCDHDRVERSKRSSRLAYTLTETLGKGSFGTVYEAAHGSTQHRVAQTMICKNGIRDQFAVTQLKNELFVLTALDHLNLMKCEDVINGKDSIYLATKLAATDLVGYKSRGNEEIKVLP